MNECVNSWWFDSEKKLFASDIKIIWCQGIYVYLSFKLLKFLQITILDVYISSDYERNNGTSVRIIPDHWY